MFVDILIRACSHFPNRVMRKKEEDVKYALRASKHLHLPPPRQAFQQRHPIPTYHNNQRYRSLPIIKMSSNKLRLYATTAGVAAITATGAWYGAGINMRQEYKQVSEHFTERQRGSHPSKKNISLSLRSIAYARPSKNKKSAKSFYLHQKDFPN